MRNQPKNIEPERNLETYKLNHTIFIASFVPIPVIITNFLNIRHIVTTTTVEISKISFFSYIRAYTWTQGSHDVWKYYRRLKTMTV